VVNDPASFTASRGEALIMVYTPPDFPPPYNLKDLSPQFLKQLVRLEQTRADSYRWLLKLKEQELAKALGQAEAESKTTVLAALPEAEDPGQVVSLDQIAALAHLKKDALRKYRNRPQDPFPTPDFPRGRRGQPNRWYWSTVLPWLRRHFNTPFPDRFPDRFSRPPH
jgi:hypothetical protein